MAPRLHELLAAEPQIAAAHNIVADETLKVMGHAEAFIKTARIESYFDDDEARKLNKTEIKAHTTTVLARLGYSLGRTFMNYFDFLAQKDATNQKATADLIVNGQIMLPRLAASTLLSLENRLPEIRKQLEAAPTLQAGPVWEWDKSENLWKTAAPLVAFRTKKTIRPVTLAKATEHHPEQVQPISEDVPVAKIETTTWSGMWTSQEKMDALSRLDALLVAVKKARQRANRIEVVPIRIGEALSNFILKGPPAEELTGPDTET